MHLDDNQKITIVGLVVAILVGSGYYFYNHLMVPAPANEIVESNVSAEATCSEIIIHISGAVYREGVYRVKSQSRLFEVVKLAGGAISTADFSSINLAEYVKDGQKILIPHKNPSIIESQNQKDPSSRSKPAGSKKISINTASADELDSLEGVGPATAKKIIEARPYSKLEDIAKIPRFGKIKYERIKGRITL